MFLEDNRIRLRALEPEDIDLMYEWENKSHLWEHGNTLTPYSRNILRRYLNEVQQLDIYESKQLRLMIDLKSEGCTIGAVDLFEIDVRNSRSGIGILIDEDYRKENYAYDCLNLMKDYVFDFLRLNQLYAHISTDNMGSLRLFEKAGYKSAGILKNWIQSGNRFKDVQIVQLIHQSCEQK